MLPLGHVPWLLGHGGYHFGWLVKSMTITHNSRVPSTPGPSVSCHISLDKFYILVMSKERQMSELHGSEKCSKSFRFIHCLNLSGDSAPSVCRPRHCEASWLGTRSHTRAHTHACQQCRRWSSSQNEQQIRIFAGELVGRDTCCLASIFSPPSS